MSQGWDWRVSQERVGVSLRTQKGLHVPGMWRRTLAAFHGGLTSPHSSSLIFQLRRSPPKKISVCDSFLTKTQTRVLFLTLFRLSKLSTFAGHGDVGRGGECCYLQGSQDSDFSGFQSLDSCSCNHFALTPALPSFGRQSSFHSKDCHL